MTVCNEHKLLIPTGERCPLCVSPEYRRRHRNNVVLGRNTRHWRLISARARRDAAGVCPGCGGRETAADKGSKLTCDLPGGGDHSKARLADVRVRCRSCHGRIDGGRPAALAR